MCCSITTYEIQDFALYDEMVQTVHHFFDTCGVIPPVDIEDINVGGTQLLQGIFQGEMHRFDVVSNVVCLLADVCCSFVVASVLPIIPVRFFHQ